MKINSERGWQPCPEGEFGQLAQRLTARRQRQTALNALFGVGAFLVAGAAVAAVSYQIASGPLAGSPRGSCSPPPSCNSPGR